MSLHLQLNKAIRVRNRDVAELTLRDPVAADFFELGLPMVIISLGDDTVRGLEFRMNVLAKFIGRLAGISSDTVKTMAMRDVGRCQAFIMSFIDSSIGEANHG